MATPFPFVAGAVLEAAELNAITELPSATKTASYVLVAGDAGSRVVMNVASANTVTVNNSLFSAGQIVQISNIGAGVTTVTAGAGVTINSADVLTLAQYQGGALVFSSASAAVWFPTAKTVASGLTLISTTTATSGSSVAVSNCFSSSYDSYRIMVTNLKGSTAAQFQMQMGATTTGYYWGQLNVIYSSGVVGGAGGANDSKWLVGQVTSADVGGSVIDIINPNLAAETCYQANGFDPRTAEATKLNQGWLNDTTQYTGFTVLTSSGTFSSITIRVYGYANS